MAEFTPGWASPEPASKWHWFDAEGRCLCARWWVYDGPTETGNDDSPDNCPSCRNRLEGARSASDQRAGAA